MPFIVVVGFRAVSCSFPMKCFAQDCAPTLCMPLMVMAKQLASQVRVRREAFPVSAPECMLAKRSSDRSTLVSFGSIKCKKDNIPESYVRALPLCSLPM